MKLRESNLKKLKEEQYDVLIVGGGINGSVAAAALSGKGAKVALIDKGDFVILYKSRKFKSCLGWGEIS